MRLKSFIIIAVLIALGVVGYYVNQRIRADVTSNSPVEDLGGIVHSSHIGRKAFFRDRLTNKPHLLVLYDPAFTTEKYRIVDVDLEAGTVKSASGSLGRTSVQGLVNHSNGKFYITSSSPNYLIEYNPATGQAKELRKLADTTGYIMVEGPDKALYIGGATDAVLQRYDPATGQYDNYGRVEGTESTRWVYYMDTDGRYIYGGIGQSNWYLAIYDRQTNTQQILWKELDPARVLVTRGADGIYAQRLNADKTSTFFKLTNGVPTELPAGFKIPPVTPSPQQSYCSNVIAGCHLYYVDQVDMSEAMPDSSTADEPLATYRWRLKGQAAWSSVSARIPVTLQSIQQLINTPDGKMIGTTGFYGPVFRYDPATHTRTVLPSTQRSLYDIVSMFDKSKIFFIGYPSSVMIYDTLKKWHLSPQDDPVVKTNNPHQLKTYGKYIYYGARGSDGLLYTAVQHERDSTGSEIAWFDPTTEATSSLREPFLNYNIRDLQPILGGTKLVLVTQPRGVEGSAPVTLFIFDVETKKVVKTITPLTAGHTITKVMENPWEPGMIFGVNGTNLFKVNAATGAVVFTKPLDGLAFPTLNFNVARLTKGPDGLAWFGFRPTGSTKTFIVKVNPGTAEMEQVREVDGLGNMIFQYNKAESNYDLYLYGGSLYGKSLRMIRGILPFDLRTNLTITAVSDNPTPKSGDLVTYSLSLRNGDSRGSNGAINIRVANPMPAGTTFVSASDEGNQIENEVVWNIDSLEPSERMRVTFTVKVN